MAHHRALLPCFRTAKPSTQSGKNAWFPPGLWNSGAPLGENTQRGFFTHTSGPSVLLRGLHLQGRCFSGASARGLSLQKGFGLLTWRPALKAPEVEAAVLRQLSPGTAESASTRPPWLCWFQSEWVGGDHVRTREPRGLLCWEPPLSSGRYYTWH